MIRQPPQIPMQFYGRVWIGGILAPAGQEVRAVIEGTSFSMAVLTDSQGRYGWDISNIFKLDTGYTDCSGRTVIFYVNGVESVRVSFEHGQIMPLDLQGAALAPALGRWVLPLMVGLAAVGLVVVAKRGK